jgi:hypothetical protein
MGQRPSEPQEQSSGMTWTMVQQVRPV